MNRSLRVGFFFFALISLLSCKKLVEETQKNAFVSVMTDGQWQVDDYLEGTISETALFAGYLFKFESDGTVAGIGENRTTEGTWIGDISNYSINSSFPQVEPLKKLNGTWKITSASKTLVHAEMTTPDGKKILRLRKA